MTNLTAFNVITHISPVTSSVRVKSTYRRRADFVADSAFALRLYGTPEETSRTVSNLLCLDTHIVFAQKLELIDQKLFKLRNEKMIEREVKRRTLISDVLALNGDVLGSSEKQSLYLRALTTCMWDTRILEDHLLDQLVDTFMNTEKYTPSLRLVDFLTVFQKFKEGHEDLLGSNRMYLFGSIARDTADHLSDIDIMMDFQPSKELMTAFSTYMYAHFGRAVSYYGVNILRNDPNRYGATVLEIYTPVCYTGAEPHGEILAAKSRIKRGLKAEREAVTYNGSYRSTKSERKQPEYGESSLENDFKPQEEESSQYVSIAGYQRPFKLEEDRAHSFVRYSLSALLAMENTPDLALVAEGLLDSNLLEVLAGVLERNNEKNASEQVFVPDFAYINSKVAKTLRLYSSLSQPDIDKSNDSYLADCRTFLRHIRLFVKQQLISSPSFYENLRLTIQKTNWYSPSVSKSVIKEAVQGYFESRPHYMDKFNIYLMGSFAENRETDTSDVDLAYVSTDSAVHRFPLRSFLDEVTKAIGRPISLSSLSKMTALQKLDRLTLMVLWQGFTESDPEPGPNPDSDTKKGGE